MGITVNSAKVIDSVMAIPGVGTMCLENTQARCLHVQDMEIHGYFSRSLGF